MRIVILRSAVEDLVRGREFYEKQGEGLGDYFDEALAADIERWHKRHPDMTWEAAKSLMVNDQYDKAFDVLRNGEVADQALRLAYARGRYKEAMLIAAEIGKAGPLPIEISLFVSALANPRTNGAAVGGSPELREEEFPDMTSIKSADGRHLVASADACAQAGKWSDAADLYGKASEIEPTLALARYLRGLALTHAGEVARGTALMNDAELLPLHGEGKRYLLMEGRDGVVVDRKACMHDA